MTLEHTDVLGGAESLPGPVGLAHAPCPTGFGLAPFLSVVLVATRAHWQYEWRYATVRHALVPDGSDCRERHDRCPRAVGDVSPRASGHIGAVATAVCSAVGTPRTRCRGSGRCGPSCPVTSSSTTNPRSPAVAWWPEEVAPSSAARSEAAAWWRCASAQVRASMSSASVPVRWWERSSLRPALASSRLPAWALALSAVPALSAVFDDRKLASPELVTSGCAPLGEAR